MNTSTCRSKRRSPWPLPLTGGSVYVLDRHDLTRQAALEGFRHGIKLAAKIVGEMATDHGSDLLEEAEKQIRSLPKDVP